jgi:mannobiose 2-epimerase
MDRSAKANLRGELEAELHLLLGTWFPRTLDRRHGGFLCDFDHRWQECGSQRKMLEYQARQTIAAARAAARAPQDLALREAASHGFRYLKETLWDHEYGGWYRMLDRLGRPLESATKHGHGYGYALSACVACYELTGDTECLELAQLAFAWIEAHAHDDMHGGYFGFYRRDGTPILSWIRDLPKGQRLDPIGTPIGFKDANTNSDLLKGLADLYRVWPDALLRKRLEEALLILRDRLVVMPGVLHMYAHPDWTPLPDVVRYGQVLRSANLLIAGLEALAGKVDDMTRRVARSMVDTMLRVAWDAGKGGFHLAGSSFGPALVEGVVVFAPEKIWWVQADGMKALLTMARLYPADAAQYIAYFAKAWDYVRTWVIDAEHGGWRYAGLDTNPEASEQPNATRWKDSSHETECLLDCLLMLDSL